MQVHREYGLYTHKEVNWYSNCSTGIGPELWAFTSDDGDNTNGKASWPGNDQRDFQSKHGFYVTDGMSPAMLNQSPEFNPLTNQVITCWDPKSLKAISTHGEQPEISSITTTQLALFEASNVIYLYLMGLDILVYETSCVMMQNE